MSMTFRNEFSWSPSRDRLFHSCRRAYFWRYYGHWNGWRKDAPASARIAYRLGKMDTLDTWAGSIVHDLVEVAVAEAADGSPPTAEALETRARARLRTGWVESRDGHWRARPKGTLNLWEHYYGTEADRSRERADRVHERVRASLRSFVAGPWMARMQGLGTGALLNVEKLDSILVAGVKVWVKPDLAYRDEGVIWLVDWKTGSSKDEDRFQIQTYAMLARERWGAQPADCRAQLAYLARGEVEEVSVREAELEQAEARVRASAETMRSSLVDAAGNEARIEDFPMAPDERTCGRCVFRQLCFGREGVAGAALAGDPAVT